MIYSNNMSIKYWLNMFLLPHVQSANMRVSAVTWLLFLQSVHNNATLEDIFSDIDIPFDCQFLVAQTTNDDVTVLTEVYRVAKHLSLQTHNYGAWSAASGFRAPERRLNSRRNNLQGFVLKAGTVHVRILVNWPLVTPGFHNKP